LKSGRAGGRTAGAESVGDAFRSGLVFFVAEGVTQFVGDGELEQVRDAHTPGYQQHGTAHGNLSDQSFFEEASTFCAQLIS
jgi:hypothetical protein